MSARVLVDTNAWTALQAGDLRIAKALNAAQAVLLTPVVEQPRAAGKLPLQTAHRVSSHHR